MASAAPPTALPSLLLGTGGLLILRAGVVITDTLDPPTDLQTLRGAPLDTLQDYLDTGWVYLFATEPPEPVNPPAPESIIVKAVRTSRLSTAQRATMRRDRPLDVRLSRHAFGRVKRPVHDFGLQE